MKKFLLAILIFLFLLNCKNKEYETDFDDEQIEISFTTNKIIIKNNSNYPIILQEILKNKRTILEFIEFKNCSFVKYQNEVLVNFNDSNNQIIMLNSIILPQKDKSINIPVEKNAKYRLEFYPVTYNFISDNIYFNFDRYSENELRYKNFSVDEIKNLNIPFMTNKETNEISGIMVYVSEYKNLTDFLEKIDFKYR